MTPTKVINKARIYRDRTIAVLVTGRLQVSISICCFFSENEKYEIAAKIAKEQNST
jgi:hypothetical protein